MNKTYVMYNPHSGNGKCGDEIRTLDFIKKEQVTLCDMTNPGLLDELLSKMDESDSLVICGGDGTLNRFVNELGDRTVPADILYCPLGSGNDFAHDLQHDHGCSPFTIKKYLHNLPTVKVNGNTYRFINGIGYGVDGYCCEVGDKMREAGKKNVNYTSIAIKALLFHYKPTSAKVTVDGVSHTYKKVWVAPTMNGRFYGGGMMPTPNQTRNSGKLSVMIMHDSGKLHTLVVFPSIFKGEHIKHKKMVDVFTGHEITVEFGRPTALQIDGETILNVRSYTAQVSD